MAMKCSICSHSQRKGIEAALVARLSLRNIAQQFGVSAWAVNRHKQNCLAGKVEQAHAEQDKQAKLDVAGKMDLLWRVGAGILTRRLRAQDDKEARCMLAELRQQVALEAELAAPAQEAAAEWPPVLKLIYDALADEPAARQKVARALASLEDATLAHTG